MPLCKPQQMSDSEVCTLCGQGCDYGDSQDAACPYESSYVESSPVLVIGIVCMGIATVGLLVLAVLAWMGKL